MYEPPEKTVFEWNNEAIVLLQDNKHDEAIVKLSKIASKLQQYAQDPTWEGFHLKPGSGYGSQSGKDVLDEIVLMAVPVTRQLSSNQSSGPPIEATTSNPATQYNVFAFFDQAFVTVFHNYQGTKGQRLVWSSLLYNIGLCYHHRELQSGATPSQRGLKIALDYYKAALQVVEGHYDDGKPEDILLLLLALFNNMGHIYSNFLSGIMETRHCANWIRTLLESNCCESFLRQGGDVGFFCLSALLMLADIPFSYAPAA